MQQEIAQCITTIQESLGSHDSLECITCLPYNGIVQHPQFVLALDVYSHKALRKVERRELFSFATLFESSRTIAKDRFFVNEIPVHIDYKICAAIDKELAFLFNKTPRYKSLSTYALWRISYADIVYKKSDWFSTLQQKLTELPSAFWNNQERALRNAIEHRAIDITTASLSDDALTGYLVSAQLIRNICRLLHVRARLFDPGEHLLNKSLREACSASEELLNRLDVLLEPSSKLTQTQRVELLKLIVKDVV